MPDISTKLSINKSQPGTAPGYDEANSYFFEVNEESDWMVFHADCGLPLASWNVYVIRDPQGRIRYQHLDVNCPRTIIIHRNELRTSFNAVAGPVTAGRWRIDFTRLPPLKFYFEYGSGHLHSDFVDFRPIFPGTRRDIWVSLPESFGATAYDRYPWAETRRSEKQWYRGDCHMHTILSDGSLSPDQLNIQAIEKSLDFIIVTDHLLFPTSWPKTDLLVIPGTEVTTVAGHFNALGPRQWFDWHPSTPDGGMTTETGMKRIMREAAEAGAVCVLNHPMHKDFHWTFHETLLSEIDVLEIINCPQNPDFKLGNEQTLSIWSTLWNEGYHIPGSGGSDFHYNAPCHTDGEEMQVGDPSTYVFAEGLSAETILNGIRKGNSWVSRGPELDIEISAGGENYLPGSDLTRAIANSPDGAVHFQLKLSGIKKGSVCWIENGEQTITPFDSTSDAAVFYYQLNWAQARYAWARVDIRSESGEVVAFVNPVFTGSKTSSLLTWAEAVEKAGFETLDLKSPGALNW